MVEFFFEYGLFLAKAVTFVIAAGATTLAIVVFSDRKSVV